MSTTGSRCPTCGGGLKEGDRFCEQCGARLVDDQRPSGECQACGADAVSDRGRVHRRNEDSFFVEIIGEGAIAVVVCDGISSASAGNIAARNAANTAGRVLKKAMTDPTQDGNSATVAAIEAARGA